MLAENPALKRMSTYDNEGILLSASHSDESRQLPAGWLTQLKRHAESYGFKAVLPVSPQPRSNTLIPNWRMPFLLPLIDSSTGKMNSILVVQLDVGYLAALLEHIDLGNSGILRLLDNEGQERLRINSSGVVASGPQMRPDLPLSGDKTGKLTQFAGDRTSDCGQAGSTD